jgi:hypothetical protein
MDLLTLLWLSLAQGLTADPQTSSEALTPALEALAKNPDAMTSLAAVAAGLGLSAAAGFRVFVPLFVAAVAGHYYPELLPVGEGFDWLVSWPAIVLLGTATAAEIGAYYIPWVDNLLDSIATPAALLSGTLISASVMPDMPEYIRWSLAAIAGGGSAGLIQAGTVITRGLSTATSGGATNPIVSTTEAGGSFLMSLLALLVPFFLMAILLLVFCWIIYKLITRRKKKPPTALPGNEPTRTDAF